MLINKGTLLISWYLFVSTACLTGPPCIKIKPPILYSSMYSLIVFSCSFVEFEYAGYTNNCAIFSSSLNELKTESTHLLSSIRKGGTEEFENVFLLCFREP